jgi:hypothetical protein
MAMTIGMTFEVSLLCLFCFVLFFFWMCGPMMQKTLSRVNDLPVDDASMMKNLSSLADGRSLFASSSQTRAFVSVSDGFISGRM